MIKNCAVCTKEFVTYPSKILLGRGKYCSKECCLSVTNKILEENGKKTRWILGQKTHNRKDFIYTQSREDGKLYKLIYVPDHPFKSKRGYVREHRLVMEKHLGRYLTVDEIVHHKDENTLNNNINNLELMLRSEHTSFHVKGEKHWNYKKITPQCLIK